MELDLTRQLGPYLWLNAYCLAKPGVTRDYQPDWEAVRYFVGGRMFCMVGGDRDGRPIITLKLEPAFGDVLRRQFPGQVVPGYHMNKIHWNSLYVDGAVPDAAVRDMLDNAWHVTMAALGKKERQALGFGG